MANVTRRGCVRCTFLVLACGACSHAPVAQQPVTAHTPTTAVQDLPPLEGSTGPGKPRNTERRVGDVWVHRFSGAYRGSPLILREEVVAKKGNLFTVDYVLKDEKTQTHLRVELTSRTERVVSVRRVEHGQTRPSTLAEYEAMIEKTIFVPSRNEGKLNEQAQTCLIGPDELACDVAKYRVRVGEEPAILSVARNAELKRDVSGEVTAVDGTMLYHAELVEMRRGKPLPGAPGYASAAGPKVLAGDHDRYSQRH